MADLARIKRNVAKMAGMSAPEADIDGYIASEGVTIDDVKNFKQPEKTLAQSTGEAAQELGAGYIQGGKKVVSGILQAGADVAGAIFPESQGVQDFRGLVREGYTQGRQRFEAQTPQTGYTKAGEIAGEVAPYIAALPTGGATLGGRVAAGVAGGAIAGATGVQTENLTPEQALTERGKDAAISGAVGGAVPVAFQGVKAVTSPVIKGMGRLIKGQDADKILARVINPEQASETLGDIQQSNVLTLADVAGDEVVGLTRMVGKVKGGARNLVSDALEKRQEGATGRVISRLANDISSIDTYFGNLDDLAKARATMSAPLYQKAYQEGVGIDRGNLNKLLQDKRIISAIDDAKANYGVRLEAPSNSLETLDGAKKVLDDTIGEAIRAGKKQKAASYLQLKSQLVSELDAASPTYSKARKVFSDFSSLEKAQQQGLEFSSMRPEELNILLKSMDNTQKEAFKIGVRANLQTSVEKAANPARAIFGNDYKKKQLQVIFSDGAQYKDFSRAMLDEMKAMETRTRVLGGSRTDINLTDDADFIVAAADAAKRGIVATTLDKTVGAMAGAAQRRYAGLSQQNALQLAKILTDKRAGEAALKKLIADAPKEQQPILRHAVDDYVTRLTTSTAALNSGSD